MESGRPQSPPPSFSIRFFSLLAWTRTFFTLGEARATFSFFKPPPPPLPFGPPPMRLREGSFFCFLFETNYWARLLFLSLATPLDCKSCDRSQSLLRQSTTRAEIFPFFPLDFAFYVLRPRISSFPALPNVSLLAFSVSLSFLTSRRLVSLTRISSR